MLSERARGVLAIAATYFLFLLCAQFGFLEQLRHELPAAGVQRAMAAMGIAGLLASVATGHWLRPQRARLLARVALAAAAVAATLTTVADGALPLMLVAVALGGTLGVLTVTLAAALPELLPGPRLGLAAGLGTGLAYFGANLPPLFAGSPTVRALVPAAVAALAAILLPAREAALGAPAAEASPSSDPPFAAMLIAFALLVALDACAFAVIQTQPALLGPTWGSDERRLLQAGVHLLAALAAGVALDAGRLRGALAGTWLLFALAFGLLLGGGPLLGLAGPLYAVGISSYSTALALTPSRSPGGRLPARWRAALLYGFAGWLGSAAGVGAAQDLGTIPRPLLLAAGAATAALFAGSVKASWPRLVASAAPAVLLGAVTLVAFRLGGSPRVDRSSPPGEPPAVAPAGEAVRGRAVYIAEGCIHCHSQYVRSGSTHDEAWWGPARPLDRTTIPVLIGNRRQGPDLAAVGNRRDALWNREHLREPRRFVPASRMPSYAHLFSDGDRRGEDLVAYLASLGRGTLRERDALTAAEPLPAPAGAASAERGRALFATWCARCHGEDARGHGMLAAVRPAALLDLTRPEFRLVPEGAGSPPLADSLARVVRHGLPPTTMPGHEYLTDQEVVDLAAFVQSLHGSVPR